MKNPKYIGFVHNFIGHIYRNFCEDSIISVTSCTLYIHTVSLYVISLISVLLPLRVTTTRKNYVQQWNMFKCQTSTFYFSTYRPNLFKHFLTHARRSDMRDSTACDRCISRQNNTL